MKARLRAVRIAAKDLQAAGAFLASVCGAAAVDDGDEIRVTIDDAALIVSPSLNQRALGIAGLDMEAGDAKREASATLNGLEVRRVSAGASRAAVPADVILDHIAIGVKDLEGSAKRWEAATDVPAELIGAHPISDGAFLAARLEIQDRMIELVSPVPGFQSALASRLDRSGEGPVALALPAKNLDAKLEQLTALGVKLLWQDPHWLIHPANPACVLIQLSPRVGH